MLPALAVLTAFFMFAAVATALASSVATAVVDATAPTGSVTLSPGDSGTITINMSVTGRQDNPATFKVNTVWSLAGGIFTGTSPVQFTVPPRAAGDPATTFTTSGTLSVSSGQATGTFTLAVGAFDIATTSPATLAAGASSNYQITVAPPADSTQPVIAPSVSGTLGSNNWYTSNVTVSWGVTDGESTITSTTGCGSTTISADTNPTGVTLTCSATSSGGTASKSVTIKRDATPPSLTGTPSPAANGSGWNAGSVNINYSCSDPAPGSGLAAACPSAGSVSGDGSHFVSQTISDLAGNTATWSATINIDGTAPSIFGAPTTSANVNGWYKADVTVHFTCDDSGSGVASCESDHIFSEGANQSVTGTATDNAGNSNTATVADINVDKSAPVITFVGQSPDANTNAWNDSDVTLTWHCTDVLSGVVSATVTQTLSGNGANQSATGTCTDKADNTASDTQTGINIDKSPPVITFSDRSPAMNGNGWNDSAVTVTWNCSDSVSDVVDDFVAETASGEGANQSLTGTCEDLAGNTASNTKSGINIDTTDPTASASASPGANGNGWNKTSVTVSFSGSDGLSGIDFCDAAVVLNSEGAGQSASGICTDKAGNVSAPAAASGINIDKTAPTATASASPAPNGNGWNKTNVTVSFSGSDGLSGIGFCDADVVLSSDGAGQSASGTCTDKAGNVSDPATASGIDIDKTAPNVSVTGVTNGAIYILGSVPSAGCTTSDSLSGVATNASLSTSGGPVGPVTVTCGGAKDNADNTGSASVTYNVNYAWTGFFQPVDNPVGTNLHWNTAKAGSAIPVKFNLGGNQGLDILKTGWPKAVGVTCPGGSVILDPIEELVTAGGSSLTYDTVAQQYVYVWKSDKTKMAGNCYRFDLGLKDGTDHSFYIQFTR